LAEQITVTINGVETQTEPGRLLIDLAEEQGVFIPRFCYHPGLESVAACRMCLVQIEGSKRPLEPACATQVADGMVVMTDSDVAEEAQRSVLELLLINHPLDCPICDRGGECPLQDQTLRFGPGKSRYREEKRHFPKPIAISELVTLDRERCVLCWRCVRFADEVAGDQFIDLMDRGSHGQINISADKPFDSYFSGNTIQICPVGALTSSSYRFLSRPWDLQNSATTCSYCSVGCPLSLEHRAGEVLRAQALPNDNVNSFWNCDKGRFGHAYVSHEDRLKAPVVRTSEGLAEVSWDEAMLKAATALKDVLTTKGPEAVGFIGGSHATNEDLFAASRFMREVVGTPNVDFRTFDSGFPYLGCVSKGIAGSTATIDDLDSASTILWIGPDPKEELPVLFLRIRAAVRRGARLVVVHPRRISLSSMGTHLRPRPGEEAEVIEALGQGVQSPSGPPSGIDGDLWGKATDALSAKGLVVCIGQQFVGRPSTYAPAAATLAEQMGGAVLLCAPNANSQGAIDMGLLPGVLPGHRPGPKGLSTTEMLRGAIEGSIKFLFIMGADLMTDVPGTRSAAEALESSAFVVVSELFLTSTASKADVVLPAASFAEKEGSFTNLERRSQKVNPTVASPGVARSDWRIFQDLAQRLGRDFGWASAADVAAELSSAVPTHSGFSWSVLGEAPDPMPQIASASPQRGAWPLSWELRAVDATRRRGWVWELEDRGELQGSHTQTKRDEADGGLVLLSSRVLYDGGQMVSRSVELAHIANSAFVELNPEEASSRGLASGQKVRVVGAEGSLNLELRVSEDTPIGAAFIPFDLPGTRVASIMGEGFAGSVRVME